MPTDTTGNFNKYMECVYNNIRENNIKIDGENSAPEPLFLTNSTRTARGSNQSSADCFLTFSLRVPPNV